TRSVPATGRGRSASWTASWRATNCHRRKPRKLLEMADPAFEPTPLRHALGHYTTGVTIVTTRTPEGAHTGVTVNSFTSVSLDPPLVLFCLATRSSLVAAFEQAGHFAINVLAKGQQALSNRFAKPSANTWEGVKYRSGTHG